MDLDAELETLDPEPFKRMLQKATELFPNLQVRVICRCWWSLTTRDSYLHCRTSCDGWYLPGEKRWKPETLTSELNPTDVHTPSMMIAISTRLDQNHHCVAVAYTWSFSYRGTWNIPLGPDREVDRGNTIAGSAALVADDGSGLRRAKLTENVTDKK